MAVIWEGNLIASGHRYGIVVARFNEFITSHLLDGALDTLKRHGADDSQVYVAWVPGSFEIPLAAQRMAAEGFDAVICLGALIRGDTPHFEYIAAEVSKGIAQVSMASGIPVIFGVITCDSIDQAVERAGTKAGNKGADAAVSAIEMVNLLRAINA